LIMPPPKISARSNSANHNQQDDRDQQEHATEPPTRSTPARSTRLVLIEIDDDAIAFHYKSSG